MTKLDLSPAIEAARTEAIENDLWPGHDDEMELIVRAALPHILEALAGEAQAETCDDAVWCRCVSETDPADCSECTPRLSSNWLRAKAEEARA